MNLRNKTIVIFVVTLLGLMSVIYYASSEFLLGSVNEAERHQITQTVRSTLNLFSQAQEDFANRFSDWSAWDDTYQFVQDGNQEYRDSNLVPEQLANLKLNLMLYIDKSNNLVYGTLFDLNTKQFLPLPDELKHISYDDYLLARENEKDIKTGLIVLGAKLVLVTSQPIITSNKTGPIKGIFLVGRYIDSAQIYFLGKLFRQQTTLFLLNDPYNPKDVKQASKFLSPKNPIYVHPLSKTLMSGYALINNFYGEPAIILRVDIPRIIQEQGQKSFRYLIYSILLGSLFFLFVTILLLERLVLSRLANLTDDVSHISLTGDALGRVRLSGKDEISHLSRSINRMLMQLEQSHQEISLLNDKLKSENLRMSAELNITQKLQQMILPKPEELIKIAGLDLVGFMQPAHEVGGDYYDILSHNGRVRIGIGDVTGHGLESGVLMLMVQTAVRTLLIHEETDIIKFLTTLNRTIYENIQRMDSDKYLTLALLEYEDGIIKVSGQHEEMIIVRANGKLEQIDTMDLGFPLGLEQDISGFLDHTNITLSLGDVVVLYTDGITEAETDAGEFYGLERLCAVIQRNHQKRAAQICQAIIYDVNQFVGVGHHFYDDITLVVMKKV